MQYMSKFTQFRSITGTWHVRLSAPDHHRSAGRSYCPLERSGSPRSSDRKWELARPPPHNSAHRNNTLLSVQPGFQDVSFFGSSDLYEDGSGHWGSFWHHHLAL